MGVSRRTRHDQIVPINAKVARHINRSIILNLIRERQPISRATIAQVSKLNKSTVSSIVAVLLEDQLIREENSASRTIGRNPINLTLQPGTHLVGAMYFDSRLTRIAIVDIDGTLRHSMEVETERGHAEEFVARCLDDLESLRRQNRVRPFRGIGIAVAGIADVSRSRVLFAPNLQWSDVDLGAIVRRRQPETRIVAVANDAKASALAELWFGKHDVNLNNFVFLAVGPGIGTGIVINRNVIEGEGHAAGEFGHMTLIENGEPCTCGNRGCWEAYASDRATAARYAKATGRSEPPLLHDVITAARNSDPVARDVLAETGRYLGLGIANIVKAVDPNAVIVGGRITEAWDLVAPAIHEAVDARTFGHRRAPTLLPTSLSLRPPLLGAAALVFHTIFSEARVPR